MVKRKYEDDSDIEITDTKLQESRASSEELTSNYIDAPVEITWPKTDIVTLIDRINQQLPDDDRLHYRTRLERINWPTIAFNSYTSIECYNVWTLLFNKSRRFRYLSEITNEINDFLNDPNQTKSINEVSNISKGQTNRFWYFCQEKKQQIVAKYPNLSDEALREILTKMYQRLTPGERNKYGALAKKQRKQNEASEKTRKKNEKKRKKEKPPQKPRTPYKIYAHWALQEGQVSKSELQTKWKELREKEKFFYIKWANEELQVYQKQLADYLVTHPNYAPPSFNTLTSSQKQLRDKMLKKPKRPPRSPYLLLVQLLTKIGQLKPPHSLVVPQETWKLYAKEEREIFHEKLDRLWVEYEEKFERYLENFPEAERVRIKANEGQFHYRPKARKAKQGALGAAVRPKALPKSAKRYFLEAKKERKYAGDKWKAMSERRRDKWKKRFEEARKKYIADLGRYLSTLSKSELKNFSEEKQEVESEVSEVESSEEESDTSN